MSVLMLEGHLAHSIFFALHEIQSTLMNLSSSEESLLLGFEAKVRPWTTAAIDFELLER